MILELPIKKRKVTDGSCGSWILIIQFCYGYCGSWILKIQNAVRSCGSCILKMENVSGSCGSWILVDRKCGRILWILDLELCVCLWILWILDPGISLTPKSGLNFGLFSAYFHGPCEFKPI